MPYTIIPRQNLNLENRYKSLKKLAGKEFSKIKRFIDKAKNGETNRGVDISPGTERKYIDAFCMAYRNCNKKPLSQLTKNDLTSLKQNLKAGIAMTSLNRPYTANTQRELQLVLINFLEWLAPKKYSGIKKWFVIKVPKKTPEYLKEEEIIKLFNACRTNADRFLIAVLFDSGARATEFMNIRFEDIIEPTQNFPYYKIDLKQEYSKTEGRIIGIYWKHSTDAIRDYLKECDCSDPKAQVFTKNYDAIRLFLTRLGKRVLKKRIHFHIFRKSSATYYAPKLNRQQLCIRYGWKFSSNIPDVYISRAGIQEEEVKEVILNTDLSNVQKENEEMKTKFGLMNDNVEKLKESHQLEIQEFKEKLNLVVSALAKMQEKKTISIDMNR